MTENHGDWSGSPTSYAYRWERCDSLGDACHEITGATEPTYLLAPTDVGSTIRVQEIASSQTGEGAPAVSTQTTIVQAAATQIQAPVEEAPKTPILGRLGTATLLSGKVTIRLKGTNRFIQLSDSAGIPNGAEVDATHGHLLITVATTKSGRTAHAEVYGGIFEFHQDRTVPAQTHLALTLPLTGCTGPAQRRHSKKASVTGSKHRSGPKSRRIWVDDGGGRWGTSGRYVSTTVEGTRWLTVDGCDHSEVEVTAGRVRVRNLIRGITKLVAAGERYIATARVHR